MWLALAMMHAMQQTLAVHWCCTFCEPTPQETQVLSRSGGTCRYVQRGEWRVCRPFSLPPTQWWDAVEPRAAVLQTPRDDSAARGDALVGVFGHPVSAGRGASSCLFTHMRGHEISYMILDL